MREVEKSEGNYMSRERPIGNLGDRTEATNGPTKGQTKILFLVIFSEEEKSKKKKCDVFYTHEVFTLLSTTTTTTTLMNVESSFGSSQRVVTPRGSILLLYIFLPRFSPFASFASSSSSSPLGRVLSVSAVALGSV
jgi:hypothetical protein